MNWNTGDYEDEYLAQLPWMESQEAFAFGGPVPRSARAATVGWHGTDWDPMTPAFAIVNPAGPMADLVGERLKVTYRRKSVYVFCHDESNVIEDLSLTKRAFIDLAAPAMEELHATIEVMA